MIERGDKPKFWGKRAPRTKSEADQVYRFIHGSKRWAKYTEHKQRKTGE